MRVFLFFVFFPFLANANFEKDYKTELEYINKIKPITEIVNNKILEERKLIKSINPETITDNQKKIIEEKAKKYDVFTRLSDKDRYDYIKTKLLKKVDAISPSLLIAISGIETNWGRSRIVKDANSLYKELSWDGSGLEPDAENADWKIKTFKTLEESMASFALKINSSIDYEHLRHARSLYRIKGEPTPGRSVAHNFNLKSPLKNYTGLLDYTITFYQLDELDRNSNYFLER